MSTRKTITRNEYEEKAKAKRQKAYELKENGKKIEDIGKDLGISVNAARALISQYKKEHGLIAKKADKEEIKTLKKQGLKNKEIAEKLKVSESLVQKTTQKMSKYSRNLLKEKARKLFDSKMNISEIARLLKKSRATILNYLNSE